MGATIRRRLASAALVVAAMAAMAPGARASVSPTLSLDQSAGTTAGSMLNLGLDLKFADTGTDSPRDLTLNLPPGLLANASIDGGGCLRSADLADSTCQVGTGTVVADAYGTIPITTPVTFDLVPPPQPGDLAGLAVNSNGTQIGTTADVRVRPSGDPLGVGVTIDFLLPNSLYGVPSSIAEISSTFDGLRYPTTCPSTPQNFNVSVDSYSDPTVHVATAPLSVTGCSSLPYSPAFAVTATRDSGDSQVEIITQVTQAAGQAPGRSLSLVLPRPPLLQNLAGAVPCANVSSGDCSPVGSVTASSPLYPTPLTGQAFLTGSGLSLALTLVFPSPFPITLTGPVDLVHNSTTFTSIPDLPLTSLKVTLNGGADGLFKTTCAPPSATATAILTDQNGDKTVDDSSHFTVVGCVAAGSGAGVSLNAVRISGLASGRPSLSFKVRVAKDGRKLKSITVALPAGLDFSNQGVATRSGITLIGASIERIVLSHGHLVVTLRKPASSVVVKLNGSLLRERASLERAARQRRLHKLSLTVVTQNTKAHRDTIRAPIGDSGG